MAEMDVTTVLNIDDLLKEFGLDRDLMIQKNPAYAEDFSKLDEYYKRYNAQPSDSVLKAVNNIVLGFMAHLKKENPELFSATVDVITEEELVDNTFSDQKKDLIFFIEQGNQDAIDDLFNQVGPDKTKRLLSYDNYKSYLAGLKTRNSLIIDYLQHWVEKLGLFSAIVIARDGAIMNQLFSNNDKALLKKALDALAENPQEAKTVLKKINALEQAIEMGDSDLTEYVEELYEKYSVNKKIKEKGTKVVKEESDLKSLINDIMANKIPMDVPLVSRLEKKMAIRVLNSAEEIVSGKPYRFVIQTPFSSFFDGKQIYSDINLTILEKEPNDFEKQFGTSIYELGFAWYNIKNLLSVDDILSVFYLGNISTALMVDRNNEKLRQEYKDKLKEVFADAQVNKIGGRFYKFNQSNLRSLQRSGFLDQDFCPTKLLYCVMVLHAFPFPAYTHPFEFISIDTISSLFQFQVLKGEFGNESFYTDGDILYHNFHSDSNPPQAQLALVDLSRTVILNLKSNGRADIKKTRGNISSFIPFLYTVPKSGLSIPTFSIKALDVQNRKINWGVYEMTGGEEKVYVNSYGVDNFLYPIRNSDPEIYLYKGQLSDEILSNPKEGVIVTYDKRNVAVRGINSMSFLSENFGKNWINYYEEMFTKSHLQKQVLDQMTPEFIKALHINTDTKIESVNPNLQYKVVKKLDEPVDLSKATKQVPKPQVVIKDDRIYITRSQSREDLDKSLWIVYDKVQALTGVARDEAILDEMYANKVERILPNQLVLLGFDLAQYAITKNKVVFQNKYQLRIPNLLSYVYYLEKL